MDKVKPNLEKPFSIEAYEAGAEFCTREGYKARILGTDLDGDYSIAVYLHNSLLSFRSDGAFYDQGEHDRDLFEILPETTHREEGTPLDIPPLPEVEGWKGAYLNSEDLKREWANGMMWSCFMECSNRWGRPMTSHPEGDCEHYILYTPAAEPTTIEDLFADGDVCYIIRPEGSWFHLWVRPCSVNVKRWEQRNYRYSNSPLTKWEDAKPFVGKEGE